MTSTTPYKDELIRIATLLDLPDDTDPTAVAEAVRMLKADCASTHATLSGVQRMVDFQTKRAEGFRIGLEDAVSLMEKSRDDLRAKAGADLIPARAIIARIAGDLNTGAAEGDTALEEPTPPETDEED